MAAGRTRCARSGRQGDDHRAKAGNGPARRYARERHNERLYRHGAFPRGDRRGDNQDRKPLPARPASPHRIERPARAIARAERENAI